MKDTDQEIERNNPVYRDNVPSTRSARKSIGQIIENKNCERYETDQPVLFPGNRDPQHDQEHIQEKEKEGDACK